MRPATWLAVSLAALPLGAGCSKGSSGGSGGPKPSAATSAPRAPASSSEKAAPAPAASSSGPISLGAIRPPALAARTLDEQKACEGRTKEMDQGLASGSIALAAKSKEFAVAYFYSNKVKGEGLLAFTGFSTAGLPLGTPHGLGKGFTHRPHIVPRKDQWIALWFDAEGLAYAKSGWAAALPTVERMRAVTAEEGPHTAVIRAAKGTLVATAPVAPGPTAQLGFFEFASEEGEGMKALGTSHGAAKPQHPALVEVEDGFLAAWENEQEGKPSEVHLARFDPTGRELGTAAVLSGPSAHRPAVANTKAGALVAWDEGEGEATTVMVRALDEHGAPTGPARPLARGAHAKLASMGERTALSFADFMGRPSVVTLGDDGAPSPVLLVLHGKNPVADAPALAFADDGHLGIAYVLSDGMKSVLKIIKVEGCFDP